MMVNVCITNESLRAGLDEAWEAKLTAHQYYLICYTDFYEALQKTGFQEVPVAAYLKRVEGEMVLAKANEAWFRTLKRVFGENALIIQKADASFLLPDGSVYSFPL